MSSAYSALALASGTIALALSFTSPALAEEAAESKKPVADRAVAEAIAAQPAESLQDEVNTANNPLADLIALSLHNYYFPKLNGIPDESANTFWLRLVTPFWRIIPRLSLPIQVVPAAPGDPTVAKVTGVGDLNVFATFVVTPDDSPAMFGIGPIYTKSSRPPLHGSRLLAQTSTRSNRSSSITSRALPPRGERAPAASWPTP